MALRQCDYSCMMSVSSVKLHLYVGCKAEEKNQFMCTWG